MWSTAYAISFPLFIFTAVGVSWHGLLRLTVSVGSDTGWWDLLGLLPRKHTFHVGYLEASESSGFLPALTSTRRVVSVYLVYLLTVLL